MTFIHLKGVCVFKTQSNSFMVTCQYINTSDLSKQGATINPQVNGSDHCVLTVSTLGSHTFNIVFWSKFFFWFLFPFIKK